MAEEINRNNSVIERYSGKVSPIVSVGEYAELIVEVVKASLHRPPAFFLIIKQLYDIGVSSLPVVVITGFSTGLVLAAQSFYQLSDKGLSSVTGILVGKAMITELGPVLSAFMVTGRVGAAMCAEIGTMRVTEQIDALQTMAVNPNSYLIAPRLIAGFSSYFNPMPEHISIFDFFIGVTKAFVFGFLIMTIACYKGMKTSGGAEGVGRSTTSSVVITYCCILLSNFFLTMGLNILHSKISKVIGS